MRRLTGHTSETLALSLLSAGEAAHAMSSFLPSSFTVKALALCGNDGEVADNIAKLRSGYRPALLFGLGLGAVVSILAHSALPLIFSAVSGGAMVMLYEQNLPPEMRLRNPFELLNMATGKPKAQIQAGSGPALMMAFNPASGSWEWTG